MAEKEQVSMEKRLDVMEKALTSIAERLDSLGGVPDLSPVTDPPPDDFVRNRIDDIFRRNPKWITDPPPEDFLNVRVLDLIRRYRGGFTDPAPNDFGNIRLKDLLTTIPGGGFTDPAPDDISRLTAVELETQLHRINAEMVRLKSVERLFANQLEELQKG